MANKPGFRTVSTVLPTANYERMLAYLEANGGTVSGVLKHGLSIVIGEFKPETKSELQLALAAVQRMAERFRKVAPKCDTLPADKAVEALTLLEAELVSARPAFHAVAASDIKYEPLYRNLITSTRNKLRAATTRSLIPAEPEAPTVRKLKDILRDSKLPDIEIPASLYNVEASELIAAGYDPSLSMDTTGVSKDMEAAILRDITWLRGAVSGVNHEWLPDRRCEAGEMYLGMVIERNKALISESHPKASPERLAYYEKLAEHVATLPTP